jgi:hypothetical protein
MPATAILDQTQIVARIDAIIRELEALRRQLTLPAKTTPETHSLTEELYGSLGHGTWDEYDLDLDWKRFSNDGIA